MNNQNDCGDKNSKKLIRSNTLPLLCIPEITYRLAGKDSFGLDNNSPSSSKHSRPSITIDDTSVETRRKSSSSSAKCFYKSTSSIKNQLYFDDADLNLIKSSKNRFSYGFVPQFNIFHKRSTMREFSKVIDTATTLRRLSLER